MRINCTTSVTPELIEDKCKGRQVSTNCVIFEDTISYLSLPENSSATLVIETLLLSLVDARDRITTLESNIESVSSRITTLEGN